MPTHPTRPQNLTTCTKIMLPVSPPHVLINTADSGLSVPPLDVKRFDGSFEYFCTAKRLVLDRKLLHVKGEEVNLHSLHEEVMRNRGYDIHEVRR